MRKVLLILFSLFWFAPGSYGQSGNVGINTSEPQQKLHIAGETSSMRVDNLNSTNNTKNKGPRNAPLYVNANGVLTLEFDLFYNSGDNDLFNGDLSNANIDQSSSNFYVAKELFTRQITVVRDSYLEVKFSVSFEVYLNAGGDKITDNLARVVDNYIILNNGTRRYGMTSKCYTNGALSGVNQMYFNNAATYIFLPAGTHTIRFFGGVGSDRLSNNPTPPHPSTYVKFGTAQDMMLMRIY